MGVRISDMTQVGSVNGTELIPSSLSGAPRTMTPSQLSTYIIDQIEALGAASAVDGNDKVYILDNTDGALKPVDIDTVAQHAIDTIWGKTAETSADGADVIPLKDGGATEKTLTLSNLATYIQSAIESSILDVSDLDDGSGTLATTDYLLVTQGTTAKQITVQDIYDAIYTGLAAHVEGKTDIVTGVGTDVLYTVRSGTPYAITLTEIATFVAASATISGSGTTDALAQWEDSTTLKAGPSIVDSVSGFGAGADTALPTTLAVRGEMNEIINDSTDIGADLAGTDTILVDDGANGTQRKSALSRVWTYIESVLQAVTDVSSHAWVLDEDTMVSDDATKVPTQQSVKAYVDASAASPWDGDIADVDLDGGTDIGAPLADADLILVDDGAVGTNRKSALSRVWTYILGKLQVETDVSAHSWVVDEDNMASNLDTKVPTQQSVKAYVDTAAATWDGDIADVDLDGGTDIGAALADADLILVDDGAVGTNRKSAISRVWTYILTKLQAETDVSTHSWVVDEDTMVSNLATKVPTQQSVKAYVDTSSASPWDGDIADMDIDGGTDIGADLADADLIVVDDGAVGTNRKSAMSRVWTYVQAKIVALTDVSTHGYVLDEDTMVSNDATKLATQQSIKAYVDTSSASPWDGDITDMDIDGGTDIGADLADADLIVVDDGAVGTNRKSAMSRVWTYIQAKIVALTDVSTHNWVIDEDNMASDLDTKVPTQQSVKAYVDASAGGASAWSDLDDTDGDAAMRSDHGLQWTDSTLAAGTADTEINRATTGVVRVTNPAGTAGALRVGTTGLGTANGDFAAGSASGPVIYFDQDLGLFTLYDSSGNRAIRMTAGASGGMNMNSGSQLGWDDETNDADTRDTGLARDSAGVVRVSDGSTGKGSLIANALTLDDASNLAGSGLANNSGALDVDINGLTAQASPTGSADYVMIYDAGLLANRKVLLDNLPSAGGSGDVNHHVNGLRLTTESGVPVSTSDRTSQSTIYLTPFKSNTIHTYDSSVWTQHNTAEVSLTLTALTADKLYDVFAYWTGSAVALELSAAWTNDTTRADAVVRQDGVWVKSGATTRRLVGTIRTTSTTTTEDSESKRFVYNQVNKVPRTLSVTDATDTWTYTTATWRQANGSTSNRVEIVNGDPDGGAEAVRVSAQHFATNNSTNVIHTTGIGIDSTTVNSAQTLTGRSPSVSSSGNTSVSAEYVGYPGMGYHAINWLEYSVATGTTTWCGDLGSTAGTFQSGLTGEVYA